uniref:palmitoyltransferase ZDHHC16A isoform X2 n=1 Tax=Solea senegalensis TaxID=28829 RepID=UPI001CD82358|nr:palmitoyltransferase ZDHHC16A isoform X2 [Solea senegalensis]
MTMRGLPTRGLLQVHMCYRCRMRWCPTSVLHLLRSARLRLCTRRGRNRLPLWIREIWAYMRLLVQSLYFNSLTDSDVVFDSVFEPVFWTVDYVTRWFGTVFVFLVVILTSSIVGIAYMVLLPLVLYTYSPQWIAWHICYGNWIIVMIAFHYYKATKTSPGSPPTEKNDAPFVSVCKKCIMPKPSRTHHCGICNSGRNLFLDAYNAHEHFKHLDTEKPGVPVTGDLGLLVGLLPSGQTNRQTPAPVYSLKDKMVNKSIIYMWVLTSTVGLALGALTIWHTVLISRGETSIERHLNSKERKRMAKEGKIYRNPFDYGRLNNLKIFLGVEKRSHWLTRVLLPSGHAPCGDGLTWDKFPVKKDLIPV